MPAAVRTRQVRALALASASFGLGLAGHLEAGGHSGATGCLLFGAGFCALSAWACSWRRLPAAAVAGVLLVNQIVMHVALVLGAPPLRPAAPAGPHAGCAGSPAPAASMSWLPGGWMILAHLVATVLAAGVIVAAEALWLGLVALARWIARVVRVVLHAAPRFSRPRPPTGFTVPHRPSRAVGARPGRGPPRLHLSW